MVKETLALLLESQKSSFDELFKDDISYMRSLEKLVNRVYLNL